MRDIHLNVLLPSNRNLTGWLRLEVDGAPVAEYRCLGRGSRGPGNTAMLRRGNTPAGTYRGTEIVDTSAWPQNSYGPWGAVRLRAIGGDALVAQNAGRRGLLIHGGTLGGAGYWRGQGALRATHGCLRLSNNDMNDLINRIQTAAEVGNMSVPVTIRVTVSS